MGETWRTPSADELSGALTVFHDAGAVVGCFAVCDLLSLPGPGVRAPEKGVDPARDVDPCNADLVARISAAECLAYQSVSCADLIIDDDAGQRTTSALLTYPRIASGSVATSLHRCTPSQRRDAGINTHGARMNTKNHNTHFDQGLSFKPSVMFFCAHARCARHPCASKPDTPSWPTTPWS